MESAVGEMTEVDLVTLESAVCLLENPSFVARAANVIGSPIERAIDLLPAKASEAISKVAQKAISLALKGAIATMKIPADGGTVPTASNWWHKGAVAASGGAGGAFGFAGFVVEVPITTTIMMRSIADVARSEGADISKVDCQLECVMVLALGGRPSSDDQADIGYFASRELLTRATAAAAAHIAAHGIEKEGAPALVRLIIAVSERYAIKLTEKAAAQAVPIIGAAGGALINTFFIDHFQDIARGHFAVRRLEERYGSDLVAKEYKRFCEMTRPKGA